MTTTMDDAATTVDWPPPGPGVWESDRFHQAQPFTELVADLWPPAFAAGFGELCERYGLPLETMAVGVVHGYAFVRPKPLGEPASGPRRKEPPPAVLKVVFRTVPAMRRRERVARQAVEERRWLDDAATWADERDTWATRIRERQAVDLAALSDEDLADEVAASADLFSACLRRHFALGNVGLGIGELLLACQGWGLDPELVPALLEGSSPSSQAARRHLVRLAEAVRAAGLDPAALDESDPDAAIERVRSSSSEAADVLAAYLEDHGWRATDNTGTAPSLVEQPALLVRALVAAAVDPGEDDATVAARVAAREAELRVQVPEAERLRFDELVTEARSAYRAADDNTGFVLWSAGTLRRSGFEAGRRLAGTDVLAAADHVLDCRLAEVVDALRGHVDRVGARAAARHDARQALIAAGVVPPATIGGAPSPPPGPDVLPPGMAAVFARLGAHRRLRFPDDADAGLATAGRVLRGGEVVGTGHAVGTGAYTGRACVAVDAEDALDRLEPGDVLVCAVTVPTHDPLFTIAGAVVTAVGGPLGHTAVMAREFGLPAVVGTGPLAIADGDEITVLASG